MRLTIEWGFGKENNMAENNTLETFAEAMRLVESPKKIWNELAEFTRDVGIDALSYYHIAPPGSQDFSDKYFASVGFDQDAADEHRRNHTHFDNPFVSRANPLTRPLFWGEVVDNLKLTDKQKENMDSFYHCKRHSNGLVLPVFGPKNRNGCVVYRFLDACEPFARENVHRVSLAAHLAHVQFCHLRAKNAEESIHLTSREKEVLTWVARGKSNTVIADIVGISQHTVNGYLRRIYLKTRTTDRTSAALRAVADSLIDF